jgi:hypothetical protein
MPRGPGRVRRSLSGKRIKAKGMSSGRATGPLQTIQSTPALRSERIKALARQQVANKGQASNYWGSFQPKQSMSAKKLKSPAKKFPRRASLR